MLDSLYVCILYIGLHVYGSQWTTPIQGRFRQSTKYTEDGAQSSATNPIYLNYLLAKIIQVLTEVRRITSPKSRNNRAPKQRISSMGTHRGHTTLSQAPMKQQNSRVSRMLNWVISSVGRLKSKSINGLLQLRCRFRVSIRGPNFSAMLMSLIRSIVIVTCVATFV